MQKTLQALQNLEKNLYKEKKEYQEAKETLKSLESGLENGLKKMRSEIEKNIDEKLEKIEKRLLEAIEKEKKETTTKEIVKMLRSIKRDVTEILEWKPWAWAMTGFVMGAVVMIVVVIIAIKTRG